MIEKTKLKAVLITILVALHSTHSLQSFNDNKVEDQEKILKEHSASLPVDCDSYFNDVIQIDEEMMNEFTDLELRNAFKLRNKSMTLCLDFFTKFLAKLDYYLDNIEGLESEEEESGEIANYDNSYAREVRRVRAKNFWKRNVNKNKFW